MNKKISSWKPNTRRPKRYPKDPILIVCEDSCVSQTYFNILKNEKRLNYVDIPARKGEGISLTRLLEYVIDIHKHQDKKYSEIYFVIDKDTHHDYEEVLQRIEKLKLQTRDGDRVKVKACTAIPCFEFWLMCHIKAIDPLIFIFL